MSSEQPEGPKVGKRGRVLFTSTHRRVTFWLPNDLADDLAAYAASHPGGGHGQASAIAADALRRYLDRKQKQREKRTSGTPDAL